MSVMTDNHVQSFVGRPAVSAFDPAKGVVGGEAFIFVLRFSPEKGLLDLNEFCDQAQEILYDDIGCTGHFRVAPLRRKDLNEHFILVGPEKGRAEFMPRANNELYVAFIVREDLTPISEELAIIPGEVDQFCQAVGLTFEQIDVRELYRGR